MSLSDRYRDNLVELCNLTKGIIAEIQERKIEVSLSPLVLDIAIGLINAENSVRIINGFISRSHKHWETVYKKDESFILNNADSLFGEVPQILVNQFSELFILQNGEGELALSPERRNQIWNLLHGMIKI